MAAGIFSAFPHPLRALVYCTLALAAAGCGIPSFLITPVSSTSALDETTLKDGSSGRKVVILHLDGMIINIKSGGLLQATENDFSLFVQELDKAAADSSVVAVVIRVNSPGGTVTASDTLYQTIKRFREKTGKIVVADMQDVAASGAYYVCCACDKVVAHPTSVVGSIGVIFNTINFYGAMEKIGIESEAIKSGPLKDMGSPFKKPPLSEDEKKVMQAMIDEYYARFLDVVRTNRPIKDEATMKLVTDGRVVSGAKALEYGLVDKVGLLDDAIDLAAEMAHVTGPTIVHYRRPYGYTGSIYAQDAAPQPLEKNAFQLNLPGLSNMLPTGFYYMWSPG